MKENFQDESKKKWTQIFRKKWFFPAVYLMIAAMLVTGVIWFQDLEKKLSEGMELPDQSDSYLPNLFDDEESLPVTQQKEIIKMPMKEDVQAEIVTKFYDFNDELEVKEQALNLYNSKYYQSTGIDITTADDAHFEVIAALSGTVTEVMEDPLRGNVVILTHGNDITTYYSSLDEVNVVAGDKIGQGEKIGTAGKNIFGEENGTHVHFEIRNGDMKVNPEQFFGESVAKVEALSEEDDTVLQGENEQAEVEDTPPEDDPADDEDSADAEDDDEEQDDASESEANESEAE